MAAAATEVEELPEGEPGKAKGGKKKLIFIAAALVVLLGGGGGYFYVQKQKAAEAHASNRKRTMFVDLPDITTNLAQAPGAERPVYLRLRLAIEVEDHKMGEEIKPQMPRLVDNFQVFLRELRPADLEGSAGLYRLKEELVRRINAAVYPARIEAVLFKDVLVQ